MKTLLLPLFSFLPFTSLLAQPDDPLSPLDKTSSYAAIARGLVRSAELLCNDPAAFKSLHCATVIKSTSEFDASLPEKIIDEARMQTAKRVKFEIIHHDELDPSTTTSDSFIDWITGSRGLRNLPRSAKAVFTVEPFAVNNLLLFGFDQTKDGRARYTQLEMLPPNHYPALKEAREWRQLMERMFAPRSTISKDDLTLLRDELDAPNCFIRLCALLRLNELKLMTFDDATKVVSATTTSAETAALTLALLRHSPAANGSLAELGIKAIQKPMVIEGVALGAAIHFLDQDVNLIKTAITFQGFRDHGRSLPTDLANSVSYPVLSAIGDAVKPLNQPLSIDPNTMLARLLVSTRALHQLEISK